MSPALPNITVGIKDMDEDNLTKLKYRFKPDIAKKGRAG